MSRITGGRARGRVLSLPVGPGIRPTSERAREALFSILGQDLSGLTVLDAFGGTGLLGLEAWSRGARVVAAERNRRACEDIRRRAAELGAVAPDYEVRCVDVLTSPWPTFDGVLADPPWKEPVLPILDTLGPVARAWLVLEADAATEVPSRAGTLPLDRTRTYGRTAFWVFRAEEA